MLYRDVTEYARTKLREDVSLTLGQSGELQAV